MILDAYLCTSDVCTVTALDLVRTCSEADVPLRIWPGRWLEDLSKAPIDDVARVGVHAARLFEAGWKGELPALVLEIPSAKTGEPVAYLAGGGEVWPEISRLVSEGA